MAVTIEGFTDAAVVLIGHGSSVNSASSTPVFQHAAELRRRRLFARVLECFWKLAPGPAEVLDGVTEPRTFIVPLFVSEGYFTEEIIPRALGLRAEGAPEFARLQRRGARWLYYCSPIGTHPRLTDALVARAQGIAAEHPFPRAPKPWETSLFIAGHGTGANENSRRAVEKHAALIRERASFADVHAVFLEEHPRIEDCYRLAATRHMVVVPLFISDGLHAFEDIPVRLGESEANVQARLRAGQPAWRNPTERHGKLVWYAPGIGLEPLITEVILERIAEASAWG